MSSRPEKVLISAQEVTKEFVLPQTLGRRLRGQPPLAVHALNGVTFSLHHGETLGIVGESGCGKSTLARCLVRLFDCDDGKVLFEGKDIADLGGQDLRAFNRRARTSFPAGSASASASRAPWRSNPRCWWPTSWCRHLMFRCRRRWSTCCCSCRNSSTSPWCSSPTICAWCGTSRTGWP
jgi:ABC-type dipeptide/oligopeptide/nickel transport system ATPase component